MSFGAHSGLLTGSAYLSRREHYGNISLAKVVRLSECTTRLVKIKGKDEAQKMGIQFNGRNRVINNHD